MKIENANISETLRYMGYHSPKDADSITMDIVRECEKEILNIIQPSFIYKIFDLEHTDQGIQVIGTNLLLTGNSITEHLKNCEKAVLMAATLSAGADNYIRRQQLKGMIYALTADCMASALIEQVCNNAEEEIVKKTEGYYCTWRFSPGYGDLPITIQDNFLKAVDAPKKIGLTATASSILLPRKSVTAIIGLSKEPISKQKRGCAICNMRDKCQFRKRGEHCGI